jgi:translation initiation factor 4E
MSASVDKYISFNRQSYEDIAGGETGGKSLSFPAWTLWEKPVSSSNDQDHYSTATRCLSRITNVEEFWKYWLCVPQPSELLEGKHFVRDNGDGVLTQIDTLMLFKEGVRPEWEDPQNAHGGHYQYVFKPNSVHPPQLDEYWNNIVMGLVGGTIEPADMITGVRLLDKSTSGRNACIRIEVWFNDFSRNDKMNQLRSSIENCMCRRADGSMGLIPKVELKSHSG